MNGFFEGCRPGRAVTHGTTRFVLPILYFRDTSFLGLFTADYAKLRQVMPTDTLGPIRAGRGRGYVVVAAYDYGSTSIGPYGEVAVTVPVVHGGSAPPVVPAFLDARWPRSGHLVLHLPVTSRAACEAGRGAWGYPKFVADMDFESSPEEHVCRMREGSSPILTLRIAKRGVCIPSRSPTVTYSVKDRALVRTAIRQTCIARSALGSGRSFLDLGNDHPVARSLVDLDLDPRPVATRIFLDRSAILPEGRVVETGVRALAGYTGSAPGDGVRRAIPPVALA